MNVKIFEQGVPIAAPIMLYIHGTNVETLKNISQHFEKILEMKSCGFPIIASGGLTSLENLDQLLAMKNIFGVTAGKAVYEGLFTVEQAIARGSV